jgi:hypothetical protein
MMIGTALSTWWRGTANKFQRFQILVGGFIFAVVEVHFISTQFDYKKARGGDVSSATPAVLRTVSRDALYQI